MGRVLVAQPPGKAPWARCLLRRDETSKKDVHTEIKTDWAADEEVRQRRRVIFNDMVQAVKQLPGGASFDQTTKSWLLKGGVNAAKDFIASLRSLDFTFAEAELQSFLEPERHIRSNGSHGSPLGLGSSQPFHLDMGGFATIDVLADEEAELDKLLCSGILDEIEEREARLQETESRSDQPQSFEGTASQPLHPQSDSMSPGMSVQICGVTSHPDLNGLSGILDKRESADPISRWLVTVDGQQYSLAEDKLRAAPCSSEVPGPNGPNATHSATVATAATVPSMSNPSGDRNAVEQRSQNEDQPTIIDLETGPGESSASEPQAVLQEPRSAPTCAICMEEKELTVFVPCGHMAACISCGQRFAKQPCPVCRKKIKRVQHVFLAV